MQQVTGRLTGDAVVKTTKSGKEVVNFRIADNETYKRKGESEPTIITTYFNCAFWLGTSVAKVLRKGAVVQLNGRASARAYQSNTGDLGAALEFNANRIAVLAYAPKAEDTGGTREAKPVTKKGTGAQNSSKVDNADDDLPF